MFKKDKNAFNGTDVLVAAFVIGIAALMVFAVYLALTEDHKDKPYAFCNNCGWAGNRTELNQHTEVIAGGKGGVRTVYTCPNCESEEIVYISVMPKVT